MIRTLTQSKQKQREAPQSTYLFLKGTWFEWRHRCGQKMSVATVHRWTTLRAVYVILTSQCFVADNFTKQIRHQQHSSVRLPQSRLDFSPGHVRRETLVLDSTLKLASLFGWFTGGLHWHANKDVFNELRRASKQQSGQRWERMEPPTCGPGPQTAAFHFYPHLLPFLIVTFMRGNRHRRS